MPVREDAQNVFQVYFSDRLFCKIELKANGITEVSFEDWASPEDRRQFEEVLSKYPFPPK